MRRRAVIVRRPTEYDELMDRYSTRGQVEFVLRSRGRSLEEVERAHDCHLAALARVRAGIPDGWASADVERDSLSRFLFAPEDVIVVVGPDGLVANVAKYVDEQVVVGVNSVPQANAGVAGIVLNQVLRSHIGWFAGALTKFSKFDQNMVTGLNFICLLKLFQG